MRKSKNSTFYIFFLYILILANEISGQFNYIETPSLKLIYYGKAHEYLVNHTARCFENSLKFHSNLFQYTPSEKVTVVIHDLSDYGYAGATAIPINRLTIGIAPYSYAYEIVPSNERMNSIMHHEIVHIVANDQASHNDKFFRSLFIGKVYPEAENPLTMIYSYLTNPRRYAPRWYHEGIAVFLETWMSGGLGRAQGAYDEMVFRTMVLDSARIYDLVGLESEATKISFQSTAVAYLYGTRFMSFLALEYGPEKLIEWTSRNEGSKGYFIYQFNKIYGLPINEVWNQWTDWEKKFQENNLRVIHKNPATRYRQISQNALGSVSRMYYDDINHKLFAAVNYPGQAAHLAEINTQTGEIRKITDVKGAALYFVTSLTYDPSSATLFYTTDNNDWRDLKSINVKTGKKKLLLKEERIGDLVFNRKDKSIWGVRHYNGISTLVRIPYPYKEWNQIYSWPYGSDIYDIDISPDGQLLTAALVEINGRQTLIMLEIEQLLQGDRNYKILCDFENSIPANFVFSANGEYLYGSSYYTGVSNIFRYHLKTDSMMIITNCESGFFQPIPLSNDSLIVLRYTADGFVPAMISTKGTEKVSAIQFLGREIVKKHPIVKEWKAESPGSIDLDNRIISRGTYKSFRHLKLVSLYPIIEGYKNFAAFGVGTYFCTPIGLHNFHLSTSYTPNSNLDSDEKWHVNLDYQHLGWQFNFTYNYADFYDLFGPTKTGFKGYSLGLQYKKTLIYDQPKTMDYTLYITGYGGLERMPDYQNVRATFKEYLAFGIKYTFKNQSASLGAVDYEKGYIMHLHSHNNYVNKELLPRLYFTFDYGFPFPLDHSSVWLRYSAGYSYGDRDDPFANFYFGGFGNNWVDYLPEKRYREYYSYPGVAINNVGGTNFTKLMAEWTLPPIRFRRLGRSSFYIPWARLALFSTGIITNIDKEVYRRVLLNLGSQIDFRMIILSHLKFTLSFGYAVAFEKEEKLDNEFMISLKIL
jgi:hypothetical protein